MKFNKEQKEGLAKVCDNAATACMIGVFIGGLMEHKFGIADSLGLVTIFVVLIFCAVFLRGDDHDD